MNPNATHISLVLDRSGSMSQVLEDTIGGFNRFVAEQQQVPGLCTLTLVQFDSQGIDTVCEATPIASVKPLTKETYQPRAWTPLYDAVAKTILATGDALKAMPEAARPSKVVFVIMTDGIENASTKFDHRQVREMIQHQKDVYQWQFVFLGANIDSYAVGRSLAVPTDATMNYAKNSMGTVSAFVSASSNLRKFRTGEKSVMNFDPDDREAQLRAGADQTGSNV